MNPQEHIAAAFDFLELADNRIAERNLLLRSELLWCAAAHAVKAVAKRRGWRNESHADLFQVVGLLARNRRDSDLTDWFKRASRLHRNMYEGEMYEQEIAVAQGQVRRLVQRLAGMVG